MQHAHATLEEVLSGVSCAVHAEAIYNVDQLPLVSLSESRA
jgi:hypothetical protein